MIVFLQFDGCVHQFVSVSEIFQEDPNAALPFRDRSHMRHQMSTGEEVIMTTGK